jgi:hypothetical protein
MSSVRTRLATLLASAIVAAVAARGVREVPPEALGVVERGLDLIFEVVLLLVYAALRRWMGRGEMVAVAVAAGGAEAGGRGPGEGETLRG